MFLKKQNKTNKPPMDLNIQFTFSLQRHQNDKFYLKQTKQKSIKTKFIFITVKNFMWAAHFNVVKLPSFGEGDFMDTVAQIPRCRSPGLWTH